MNLSNYQERDGRPAGSNRIPDKDEPEPEEELRNKHNTK